jgi:hypothetical protein
MRLFLLGITERLCSHLHTRSVCSIARICPSAMAERSRNVLLGDPPRLKAGASDIHPGHEKSPEGASFSVDITRDVISVCVRYTYDRCGRMAFWALLSLIRISNLHKAKGVEKFDSRRLHHFAILLIGTEISFVHGIENWLSSCLAVPIRP